MSLPLANSHTRRCNEHGRNGAVRLLTNIALTNIFSERLIIEQFDVAPVDGGPLPRAIKLAGAFRKGDCVLVFNPGAVHLLAAAIYRVQGGRSKIVLFDLLLQRPRSIKERIVAVLKSALLRCVDVVAVNHKDVEGYVQCYRIPREKFRYVPFKPNNAAWAAKARVRDGGYIFAGGASYRDFGALVEATRGLGVPVKIALPPPSVARFHNTAEIVSRHEQLEVIYHDGNPETWTSLIAEARLVVVPIVKEAIQAAGISVCLEAMALGKPVVISRGPSTKGLVDTGQAILYPAGDIAALRAAIIRLYNDAELRVSVARAGQQVRSKLGRRHAPFPGPAAVGSRDLRPAGRDKLRGL